MQKIETVGLPQSDDMLSDDLLEVVAGGLKSKRKSKKRRPMFGGGTGSPGAGPGTGSGIGGPAD